MDAAELDTETERVTVMSYKILLCDDEPHILRAAQIKLERNGLDVRTAFDGEEGWRILQEWTPDVMVTDFQMPRLDGLGLIVRCRADEATRGLKIIMLSAKGYELSEAEIVAKYGVSKLLRKPFSPRELLSHVQELVEVDALATTAGS